MDGMSVKEIFALASNFGISGLVLIMWYWGERRRDELMRQYREDMLAQRRMYENNVILVEAYQKLAQEQQTVTIMASDGLARLSQQVETNQFCPMVRLKKSASGVEA
jgi:hypothetical protein